MLVREVAVGIAGTGQSPIGLDLCSMLPEAWRGQPLEVHEAPTAVGRLSFALRWHGRRPAILWDLATHPGSGRVRIGAPTLDPSWTSEERHGEALLAEQPLGPPGSSGVSGATGALEPSGGER